MEEEAAVVVASIAAEVVPMVADTAATAAADIEAAMGAIAEELVLTELAVPMADEATTGARAEVHAIPVREGLGLGRAEAPGTPRQAGIRLGDQAVLTPRTAGE